MDTVPRGRVNVQGVGLHIFSLLAGASYVTALLAAPTALTAVLPRAMVVGWAAGMLLSGVGGLVGNLWRGNPYWAMAIERASLTVQTVSLLVIFCSIAYVVGLAGSFGLGFTLTWMAINVIRDRQLAFDLKPFLTKRKGRWTLPTRGE